MNIHKKTQLKQKQTQVDLLSVFDFNNLYEEVKVSFTSYYRQAWIR